MVLSAYRPSIYIRIDKIEIQGVIVTRCFPQTGDQVGSGLDSRPPACGAMYAMGPRFIDRAIESSIGESTPPIYIYIYLDYRLQNLISGRQFSIQMIGALSIYMGLGRYRQIPRYIGPIYTARPPYLSYLYNAQRDIQDREGPGFQHSDVGIGNSQVELHIEQRDSQVYIERGGYRIPNSN